MSIVYKKYRLFILCLWFDLNIKRKWAQRLNESCVLNRNKELIGLFYCIIMKYRSLLVLKVVTRTLGRNISSKRLDYRSRTIYTTLSPSNEIKVTYYETCIHIIQPILYRVFPNSGHKLQRIVPWVKLNVKHLIWVY